MMLIRSLVYFAVVGACFVATFAQPVGMTQLPGKAKDIDAGAYSSVWRIGVDSSIARFEDGGWTKIDGTAERVAVDIFGFPWVVKASGAILRRNGRTWITLPGTASDIDIGANGDVWVAAKDGSVRKWSGTDWAAPIELDAVRIAVDSSGTPWVINSKGEVVSVEPTRITFLGAVTSIAAGNASRTFWVVSPDRTIWHWTAESSWRRNVKGEFSELSIAPDGKLFAIDSKGDIYCSNQ